MITQPKRLALVVGLLSTLSPQPSTLFAQGTAFTYQGRLNDGVNPANGIYDLRFAIYDSASGGAQQGDSLTNSATGVTNGLFTVTLDSGNQFPGAGRWLETTVRTNGGGAFTVLSPRQALTPTPYAITAGNVTAGGGLAGTYTNAVTLNNPANTVAGSFSGNGAGLSEVNASALAGVGAGGFWKTGGNTGTVAGLNFLGSADAQPLELKVFGQRALRLEAGGPSTYVGNGIPTGAPNVIGGSPLNSVASGVVGATIGGGGATNYGGSPLPNSVGGDFDTISGGYDNTIQTLARSSTIGGGLFNTIQIRASFATIGGGANNTIQTNAGFATVGGGILNSIGASASQSTIAGGAFNLVRSNAFSSTIAGGYQNEIGTNSFNSIVAGGYTNVIESDVSGGTIGGGAFNAVRAGAWGATISGGTDNRVSGVLGTVPGGTLNEAGGALALAAGRRAKALHDGAFVWADSTDADFSSTGANQFNVRANGGARLITGGAGMTLDGQSVLAGTVPSGGLAGTYSGAVAFDNSANGFAGTFSGNGGNLTNVNAAALGGLPVTQFWQLGGNAGANPAAGANLGTTDNLPLEFKVNGARTLLLLPTTNTANLVGGAAANYVAPGVYGATISGGGTLAYPQGTGLTNRVLANFATVGGGAGNTASGGVNFPAGDSATVAGGWANSALGNNGFVGGGAMNSNAGDNGTISGGRQNQISTGISASTISGGEKNSIGVGSSWSTIGGGIINTIGAGLFYATIPGGLANVIQDGASSSVIGGGASNTNLGSYATVPGGDNNVAGIHSFAAGHRAKALHQGAFVWADSTEADFFSTTVNQFAIRASGGVFVSGNLGVGNSAPSWPLDVAASQAVGRLSTTGNGNGAVLILQNLAPSPTYLGAINFDNAVSTPGQIGYLATDQMAFRVGGQERMNLSAAGLTVNGTLVSTSDRNAKENFTPVNTRAVLDKVVTLPLSEWNYREDARSRHLGPMAQDFYAAFGVGPDNKHIATVDADGVALAAIQGLNEKLEARSQKLEAENAELKRRLAALERIILDRTSN